MKPVPKTLKWSVPTDFKLQTSARHHRKGKCRREKQVKAAENPEGASDDDSSSTAAQKDSLENLESPRSFDRNDSAFFNTRLAQKNRL
jgi:hypothetical protein